MGGPLALADFNGDGLEDIASGHSEGMQVMLNARGGNVRAPLALTSTVGPFGGPFRFSVGMNTTDMNRDGYADLILDQFWDEHGYFIASVDVLLGGLRNSFTRSASPGVDFVELYSAAANPPAIGDFNGDGLLDVAYIANYPGYAVPPHPSSRFSSVTAREIWLQPAGKFRFRAIIAPQLTLTLMAPRIWSP